MTSKQKSTFHTNISPPKLVVTLAPFGKKLIAWVYDLLGALAVFILALVVGYIVIYLVTLPWFDSGETLSKSIYNNPLWLIYNIACVQYYYVWCWVKGGQTIGMKTWHLKLCKPDGNNLTWKEAYLRSLFSLGGIAIIWGIFDKENRGFHDLICNSRVVQLPKDFNKNKQPLI
ncbi:RDD family protein [Aliikangiella sp. IMCC44359]|uniref:RDD family protein n=1 Tax=Aliikangiella sp. IMCC44359 TaxID=3459125 RepID=UPI00403AB87F